MQYIKEQPYYKNERDFSDEAATILERYTRPPQEQQAPNQLQQNQPQAQDNLAAVINHAINEGDEEMGEPD